MITANLAKHYQSGHALNTLTFFFDSSSSSHSSPQFPLLWVMVEWVKRKQRRKYRGKKKSLCIRQKIVWISKMCIYNSIHFHTKQPECERMYKIPFFFGTLKHWHKISSTLTWLYTRQSIICTVFDLSQFDKCYEDVAAATDIAVYPQYNVDHFNITHEKMNHRRRSDFSFHARLLIHSFATLDDQSLLPYHVSLCWTFSWY